MRTAALLLLLLHGAAGAQPWRPLLNGKDLSGWQVRGDGIWTVLPGGILLGQRRIDNVSKPFDTDWPITQRQFGAWLNRHAWLYTEKEFGEFDLHLEYLLPPGMNSGVSIRDVTRAHYSIGEKASASDPPLRTELKGTPSHIGYEIQIVDDEGGKYPSGSIYLFRSAPAGLQTPGEWNALDIESRNSLIRVKVNGRLASEHPGEAGRPLSGPIGLQLHDQFTFVMFRNLRIRPVH
jgi:hypothetical protein